MEDSHFGLQEAIGQEEEDRIAVKVECQEIAVGEEEDKTVVLMLSVCLFMDSNWGVRRLTRLECSRIRRSCYHSEPTVLLVCLIVTYEENTPLEVEKHFGHMMVGVELPS